LESGITSNTFCVSITKKSISYSLTKQFHNYNIVPVSSAKQGQWYQAFPHIRILGMSGEGVN